MAAVDAVNSRLGKETLRSVVSGTTQEWAMWSESRSSRYTTRWAELPHVR
jgi:DNA polymerase V